MKQNSKVILQNCRYCKETYTKPKKGEHVFPFGLGGEDIFMDCVCSKCNGYFSGLELELYQKSLLGAMRSTEGISGYTKGKYKRAPFKAPILLMPDSQNEIVYEVGQYNKMEIDVRPQIILLNDQFYLEGNSEESTQDFFNKFKEWKANNLCLVLANPDSGNNKFTLIQFQKIENEFTSGEIPVTNYSKDAIRYNGLPESHNLFPILTPRLYIDDDQKLFVRSKTQNEAILFIKKLLTATESKLILYSYKQEDISQPTISVGFSFDSFKFEQATVKIGINCLLYYYNKIKDDPVLDDAISFVMNGAPLIERKVEENKNDIIDSVPNSHNIFLYQYEDNVNVRVSFFNGSVIFNFTVPGLKILKAGTYNRLLVDFVNRSNSLETQNDFFGSFNSKAMQSSNDII